MAGRMFGLTRDQQQRCRHGEPITLTTKQVGKLQRQGLVTDWDQWHYAPSGSFALAPRSPLDTRERQRRRVDLQPVTTASTKAA